MAVRKGLKSRPATRQFHRTGKAISKHSESGSRNTSSTPRRFPQVVTNAKPNRVFVAGEDGCLLVIAGPDRAAQPLSQPAKVLAADAQEGAKVGRPSHRTAELGKLRRDVTSARTTTPYTTISSNTGIWRSKSCPGLNCLPEHNRISPDGVSLKTKEAKELNPPPPQ